MHATDVGNGRQKRLNGHRLLRQGSIPVRPCVWLGRQWIVVRSSSFAVDRPAATAQLFEDAQTAERSQTLLPHTVLIELADPTHRVVDRTTIRVEIPASVGQELATGSLGSTRDLSRLTDGRL
jgi:hypothetical protein